MFHTFIARRAVAPLLSVVAALPAMPQGIWTEQAAQMPNAGPEALLRFGQSVAISGDTAVVGGPGENALGVDHGKAHVFVRSGTTWVEQAVLTAGNGGQGWFSIQFGQAVAIDGDTIVVGAPDQDHNLNTVESGQVHVYVRTGTTWFETAQVISSAPIQNEFFGTSVGISGDTMVVGVPYEDAAFVDEGAVHVFTYDGLDWNEVAVLRGSQAAHDVYFGKSVAFDGDRVVVGAPAGPSDPGRVYVFDRNGTSWSEQAVMSAVGGTLDNQFGASVSLDGSWFVTGAPAQGNGTAYVYLRSGSSWLEYDQLTAGDPDPADAFGGAVALDGGRILVGAALDDVAGVVDAGSAYAYQRSGTSWIQDTKIVAGVPDPSEFGTAVALSAGTAWIGAPLHDEGLTLGAMRGLAPAPGTAAVHGFDFASGKLALLDQTTAQSTVLASYGPSSIKSLAYDPGSGTLYGVDVSSDQLVVLDPTGGVLNIVGPVGFDRVLGLAFDPGGGVLWGVDAWTEQLITIDTATGAGTAVGPLGFGGFRSLAFDTNMNRLYGTAGSKGQLLFRINRITGHATFQHSYAPAEVESLSYDSAMGALFLTDRVTGWLLYTDPTIWMTYLVGTIGSQADAGIAYLFERPPGPTAYCTAGTSASGCSALLSASGTPSASAVSGFDLTAIEVEGDKDGLFFYGVNGRQANPWGNGTSLQCVVPPVKRGGLLTGVGAIGACDGSFVQDLNARWCPTCPKPTHNPGSGAVVQAQLWFRDPLSTSNQTTSLSDAVEFAVCP
jgi:hypothetical protein